MLKFTRSVEYDMFTRVYRKVESENQCSACHVSDSFILQVHPLTSGNDVSMTHLTRRQLSNISNPNRINVKPEPSRFFSPTLCSVRREFGSKVLSLRNSSGTRAGDEYRGFQNYGYVFGGPHNKDRSILESILGSPYLGKLPNPRLAQAGEQHVPSSVLYAPTECR